MDRAAVNLGDIADDGEAEPGPGLAGGVEPGAAGEQAAALFRRDSGAVVLDQDIDLGALRLDRHEHPPATIFGGILDEVAEHFVEVLALDPDLRLMIAGDVDRDALMEPVDRALDRLEADPHARAGLSRGAPADRPRPGEMMVDLAAHHERFAASRFRPGPANSQSRRW